MVMMTTVTEDNFNQEVLASSVPVFVHFQAPWCGICQLISPILNSYKAKWPTQVRILEINADENFKLANQYQLKTLPTLLYIEKGKVIQRIEGFDSREAFRVHLDNLARRYHLESTFESTCTPRSA